MIIFINSSAFSCRLCWSPLYTWLSQCTAAAAYSLLLPPVHCPLRRQAGLCRSLATMSGVRRWWAGPPPPAQGGSLTPALVPKADDTLAGVQLRGDRKRGKERQKKLEQLSVSTSSPILWPLSFGTTVTSESQAAQYFLHVTVIIVFNHYWCHNFATVTARWVSGKTKLPTGGRLNKQMMVWQGRI